METILQHIHEEQAFNKSEMIIDHCSKMSPPEGLEQFKFRIAEHFYNSKINTPLIIKELQGDDLQCMLAYWIKDHKLQNKDLILPYFVEHENQNYYFAIYYILIELRSVLNIAQKVDLEGEKLKQYFQYWLSLCSREMQNQFFGDAKLSYKRIIIILDGVDRFRDQNGEVRVSSWLPKVFPENIKLILTLRPESKAYEYYHNQGYLIMPVDTENDELLGQIKSNPLIFKAYINLPQSLQKQTQFLKYFYSLLSNKIDEYQTLIKEIQIQIDSKINTDEDFYRVIIKTFIKMFPDQSYQSILSLLSIVAKGVNVEELCQICSCDIQQFQLVLNFFKICLMEQNGIYLIYILSFKSAIATILPVSKPLQQSLLTVLEHSQNTIRKLEELIYHYGKQKIYFKLKEVIVNVENFLILWNPHNKFELCHHWQILESNGYDLVMEYNKAVENFIALYKPSSESLFFIMVQICRFLREFSNFENHNTPTYKHPELRGQTIEFEEIGLYNELKSLKMISKKKKKNQLIPNDEYFTNNEQINPETLNIEIKSNKVLFINYYTNQLDQELIQEYIINKKEQLVEKILKDQREQQIYYYKRWIWVQFPWLALTAKYNFSNLIQSYSKDSPSQMSIQEETQINQKAIKLAYHAKLQKQNDRSFIKNKLPSINTSIRIRTFSPVEKIEKIQKRENSANSDKKTKEFFPLIKDRLTQKKLDQMTYQNNLLKNRLKDLQTIQQNMYPSEISMDAQRYLDVIKEYQVELKKQQEQLSDVFQQMKRINIVVKLCTNNSDYNEEQAQQLGKHSKNLDKLINDQKLVIKETQEQIAQIKNKQKQENIRQKNEKKKFEKIEKSKYNFTRISFSIRERIPSETSQFMKSRFIAKHNLSPMQSTTNHFKFKPLKGNNILSSNYLENEEHILDQYKQLEEVGLHYVEDNTNLQDLVWSIQKQKELENQINDNQDVLNQLKRKKLKSQTLLKILQKNDLPSKYEEKPIYDIEGMRKNTDAKINQLKKLNIQRAAYYFFLKNIFSRVPNYPQQNIRGLEELLLPHQQQQQ